MHVGDLGFCCCLENREDAIFAPCLKTAFNETTPPWRQPGASNIMNGTKAKEDIAKTVPYLLEIIYRAHISMAHDDSSHHYYTEMLCYETA